MKVNIPSNYTSVIFCFTFTWFCRDPFYKLASVPNITTPFLSSNHVRIIYLTYIVTIHSSTLWHIISKFLKTAGKFCFMYSEIALLSCCLYYYLSLIKAYHYCKYSKVLLHLEVLLTESATGSFLRILWQLKSTSPMSFYGTTESGASSYFLILFSS